MKTKQINAFVVVLMFLINIILVGEIKAIDYSMSIFTGAPLSDAYGVNDKGVIVGKAWVGNKDTAFSYSFKDDKFVDLSPSGVSSSWAHAINNKGEIVGGIVSDRYRAYYWFNGNSVDLTPSESYGALAKDINEQGQSVGYSKDTLTRTMHAILWEKDGSYDYLISGQYSDTFARAINDKGEIVGTGQGSRARSSGLFWDNVNSAPIEISAPTNWTEIVPMGINENGDSVGYGRGFSFWGHAFLYSNNQFIDLNESDWENSFAYDINDKGEILIHAMHFGENNYRTYIWKDGSSSEVISQYKIWSLSEINNRGEFVGQCITPENRTYAFLMQPVPEPATMLLLGLGLMGLAGMRRFKD